MSLFGWRSRSEDDGDDQTHPEALPPADESVHELEELLAQAKVGTHEFTHVVSHNSSTDQHRHSEVEPRTQVPSRFADDIDEVTPSFSRVKSSMEAQPATPFHDAVAFVMTPMADREQTPCQDIVAVSDNTERSFNPRTTKQGTLAVFRTPKFRFFTEDKAVPVQLNSFQQHSCRKRHEFQSRLHDVECKVAELTAKVAHENMDLDLDLRTASDTKVYQPIHAAVETLSLHRYAGSGPSQQSTTSLSQQWLELERRLSLLDTQMTQSIHVELQDLKRTHLTSWRNELDQKVLPEAKEESAAADKRETALARRWENHAGTMARRFAEERATRAAVLMSASTKLSDLDPCRGQELMVQIAALREKLERERAERRAQDERIRRYIVDTFDSLKLAILEANPDPDGLDGHDDIP